MRAIDVDRSTRAHVSSPLNACEEAASDLERFLAHAAADARAEPLHGALYDAAKAIGALPFALRRALAAVDAFTEIGGTATGALRRAAMEARVTLEGYDDARLVREVDQAFVRALSTYDDALEHAVEMPQAFVDLLLAQRKTIARFHRELCARSSWLET